jgi:hypothetical protein
LPVGSDFTPYSLVQKTGYIILLNGAAAGTRFKHFTVEALMVGHHKDDGTWWDFYGARQVPGACTLSQRVFYHEQLPTSENTELQALQLPDCLFIQELRMWFTPTTRISIEGIKAIPSDKQIKEVKRILLGLELFHSPARDDLQNAINKSGRPRKATVAPKEEPAWSGQYDKALGLLQSELSNRGRKQFAKYTQFERTLIIKRVFQGIDSGVAEALSACTSLSDVALRYTGWQCSGIEVGIWESTRLRNVLRRSDAINGIKRKGNRRS